MLELPGGEHAVPHGNILTLSSQGSQSSLLITALNLSILMEVNRVHQRGEFGPNFK